MDPKNFKLKSQNVEPSPNLNNKYTDYKNERPLSSDSRLSIKSKSRPKTALINSGSQFNNIVSKFRSANHSTNCSCFTKTN